ncbi:Carbohydrate-binding protein [Phytophthora cinnamomi]|uniref:Carbohydrate-binding protein n=1 Tax=Phytophthora cinnamomi TaxID=4785 RepID=UPI00355A66C3|nr:Carbohydrate-binding protein [Phytophthora cinnamomi]
MFSLSNSSKILVLCVAAAAVSSGVRAEKEVAETFGLLGVPGVGVGAPGYGYGVGPGVSVGVPGLASVGVGLGNDGVNVGANVLGLATMLLRPL